MGKFRPWAKNKKNGFVLVLVLLQLLLLVNSIFPAMDRLAYFQTRIDALMGKQKKVQKFMLHLDRLELRMKTMKEKMKMTSAEIFSMDEEQLLLLLNKLRKQSGLTILRHHKEKTIVANVKQITIVEQLQGNYTSQIAYLRELESRKALLAISSFRLKNLAPLKMNPLLLGELHVTLFSPE